MINTSVLVSDVQQSNSVIHLHISILFHILFQFRLLHYIEHSYLCYTGGLIVIHFKPSTVCMSIPNQGEKKNFIPKL